MRFTLDITSSEVKNTFIILLKLKIILSSILKYKQKQPDKRLLFFAEVNREHFKHVI